MNLNDFFQSSAELFASNTKKGLYTEKLSFKAGNEYLVRLLPYVKEGRAGYHKSIFHFFQYSWRSIKDGRWTYVLSPRTYGEACPITEYYFKVKNSGNEALFKDVDKRLNYKESWYYNVYVVNDPVNPENNGKVKILQAGRQLQNIIEEACSDDPKKKEKFVEEFDVEDMRKAIFDLSADGINLNINAEPQGDFTSYKSSTFVRRKRDLGLSEADIDTILQQAHDLTTIERNMEVSELEKLFMTTFLGANPDTTTKVAPISAPISAFTSVVGMDPIPSFTREEPVKTETISSSESTEPTEVDLNELEAYLNGQTADLN